jgi:carbon starvation protein
VLFGTSNQLLAALTLVGVSVWLWRTGRPVWFALVPAVLMLATTCTALVMNFLSFLEKHRAVLAKAAEAVDPNKVKIDWMNIVNMTAAACLFALAIFVAFEAVRVYVKSRRGVGV